jgi:hypothetical protein
LKGCEPEMHQSSSRAVSRPTPAGIMIAESKRVARAYRGRNLSFLLAGPKILTPKGIELVQFEVGQVLQGEPTVSAARSLMGQMRSRRVKASLCLAVNQRNLPFLLRGSPDDFDLDLLTRLVQRRFQIIHETPIVPKVGSGRKRSDLAVRLRVNKVH